MPKISQNTHQEVGKRRGDHDGRRDLSGKAFALCFLLARLFGRFLKMRVYLQMALPADPAIDERHASDRRRDRPDSDENDGEYLGIAADKPSLRKERRTDQNDCDPPNHETTKGDERLPVTFAPQA